MKICYLNDSFPPLFDGVASAVVNYAGIYNKKYGEAMVVTPDYPDTDDSRFGFRVVRYSSFHSKHIKDYRVGNALSVKALREVTKFRPDIIHCHTPAVSLLLSLRLRRKTHAPIILTYHTKYDIDIRRIFSIPLFHKPLTKMMVFAINRCDDVWCVCQGAADNLRELGYKGKLSIMTNGVDFPKGPAEESAVDALRKELHIDNQKYNDKLKFGEVDVLQKELNTDNQKPVFLFVGRMLWYKGVRTILDALKELSKMNRDFRMIFIGDGDDFPSIREHAEENGLVGKCIFTGALTDREKLRLFYSMADLFLLPSAYDNCPITVREALACACPSVLLRGSSSAEGFTDGKTAFLIDDSPEALLAKLLEVAYDPELIRKVGNEALETLWLSWEDAVGEAEKKYRALLGQKP